MAAKPSVTTWSRLEARSRDPEMTRGVQAQVRDPLWMLGRQWQVGEFLGDDGGSPVGATVRTATVPIDAYRRGGEGAGESLADGPPAEVRVEAEPLALGLRGAVQLGQWFEGELRDRGGEGAIAAFRDEYGIPAAPPDPREDGEARRFRVLATGRAVDGLALLDAARERREEIESLPPIPDLGGAAARQAAAAAVGALLDFAAGVYGERREEPAWDGLQLEYRFALGGSTPEAELTLEADEFGGGELDWHAFTAAEAPAGGESAAAPAEVNETALVPTAVSFPGMPAARWWDFEDGQVDFGRLDVKTVDLARLLVMEFALVQGDDWFVVPVRMPAGALGRVEALTVTDTFGERTEIRPAAVAGSRPGEAAWGAYRLTGMPGEGEGLLVPPPLGTPLEGRDLEAVLFLRDEMAGLAWGVERTVPGGMDAGVDGYEAWRARVAATPPPAPRGDADDPDRPRIEYRLATDVPDNWIPLVPVRTAERPLTFRRGIMGGPGGQTARARALEPGRPYYVADEAIPRAGLEVRRRFRRARSADGSTWIWSARQATPGRGEGASGLEFDGIVPTDGAGR